MIFVQNIDATSSNFSKNAKTSTEIISYLSTLGLSNNYLSPAPPAY